MDPLRRGLQRSGVPHPDEAVKLLLQHGTSVNTPDEIGRALIHAIAYNDVNEASSSGWTKMIFAGVPRRGRSIRLLLSHGADINSSSDEGRTAPHRVAYHHQQDTDPLSVVELLLSADADTESQAKAPDLDKDYCGNRIGELTGYRVQKAIAQEGNVIEGLTPLHRASASGYLDFVRILLRHDANPSARDSAGSTPALHAAFPCPSIYPPYGMPEKLQVIKALLEAGGNFDEENNENMSIRSWAVSFGVGLDWKTWWVTGGNRGGAALVL
ncbi:hypothetical protein AJ79_08336 [Helicocarpus griseus UAMH5409]|uniref:Uncharacterized protein n=1 Tax=Helicocarpus griseus UAMH5409 TaxID=1447875 RepID=A0A2B7WTR1_9EURO|nr:hypothetical protein AJ79_08336 [Helicocarpus griseus UAMH5409]